MKKIVATAVLVLVGWGAQLGWNRIRVEPAAQTTPSEWAAEADAWVEEDLRAGRAAPALGWLDEDGHGTFEGHPPTMARLIDDFHTAGAARVWMVGIEEFAGAELSDAIAVELPSPGASRDQIFAVEARHYGGDGSDDVGQRYLTVTFD